MALAIGQVVNNRFRIDAPLGSGGMGAVYRATDLHLNAVCAVKEMVPPLGLDPHQLSQFRAQFLQEAVVMSRLSHPGLPHVIDHFSWGSSEIMVMEFIEGESLEKLLQRAAGRGLDERQVLIWANQLLDALAYCHANGVIHRDIKPANLIITPQGRVVLVDFGLVKIWNPVQPHTISVLRSIGTPAYAPPEQYLGTAGYTDARSDIYSLGATLYHALTGRDPAQATDRFADPHSLVAPRLLNPAVSQNTEAVVLKALGLEKEERFQDATQMRAAFFASSQPVVVGPRGRRRWWPLAVVPAVLLLGAGVWWIVWGPGRHSPAAATVPAGSATDTPALLVAEPSTPVPLPTTMEPVATARPTSTVLVATPEPPPTLVPTRPPQPTPKPASPSGPPPTAGPACPSWYAKPAPGKGVLLIENHIGDPLHVEQIQGGSQQWDLPAKAGDVPGRLLLQLSPGDHEFVDYTPYGGRGHIKVRIEAGKSWVSPIWFNNRYDELVYPLTPPEGCE